MTRILLITLLFIGAAMAQEPAVTTAVVPATVGPATAAASDSLNPHLLPFKPYLNRTWKGTFAQEPGQALVTDISRWERILNGQAIRMTHSVDEGVYGGETILFWDQARETLVYYYFTTAGFFTHGTMSFNGDKWVAHEMVENNANGITEVRSTSEFLPDGTMQSVAEFLQNGQWVPGHTIRYVESPGSPLIFK